MKILVTTLPADQFWSDPIAVPVFEDVRPLHREAGVIDFRLGGMITRWMERGEADPNSEATVMFSPETGGTFSRLVISGGGKFSELSAESIEKAVAAMTEVFLRAKAPVFAIAARDFKRAHSAPRDSSAVILRGIAHGCVLADTWSGHTIRLHWEPEEADLMVQELRRFRFHIPACREWEIDRAPEDGQGHGSIDSSD